MHGACHPALSEAATGTYKSSSPRQSGKRVLKPTMRFLTSSLDHEGVAWKIGKIRFSLTDC